MFLGDQHVQFYPANDFNCVSSGAPCTIIYLYNYHNIHMCILCICVCITPGGVAGPLAYVAAGGGAGAFNPAATQGLYNDHNDFLDSRAEAKKAHAERMQHLRQVSGVGS